LRTLGKGWEVLEKLKSDEKLTGVKSAKEGLADMELLFGYLDVMGVLDKVRSGSYLAQALQLTTRARDRCPLT
jgi:histidyl-tRNA synthetase